MVTDGSGFQLQMVLPVHCPRSPARHPQQHTYRVNGGQHILLLEAVDFILVGAVFLHGFPANEVDDPPRNSLLLPYDSQLHILKAPFAAHLEEGKSGEGLWVGLPFTTQLTDIGFIF